MTFDQGIQNITQPTETGEAIRELNDVSFDPKNKQSAIDLRTRLSKQEVSSIMAIDVLVQLGALPSVTSTLTSQRKRLSVSIAGLGRKEIVQISRGIDDKTATRSGFMSGIFGRRE